MSLLVEILFLLGHLKLTSPRQCSQVPDLAINPVAHPRLLQHIYTGSHPEVGSPLLLQNVPNPTTVKDTRSRPEVLNVPKDGAILSEAKSGVPTQVSGNTTAVNRSSADSNAGPGQSDNEIGCQDQPIGASLNSVITTGTDADRLATSMRNEFEVYVCAKALGVGGVMKGAKGRVLHLVSAIFAGFNSLTGFSKVLAFIFESTKSGQDVLREEVTASCLERYHQCSNNAAVAAVIEDFEPTLWRIAVPLLRKTAAGRDASIVATRLAVQVFPALRARNLRLVDSLEMGSQAHSVVASSTILTGSLHQADREPSASRPLRTPSLQLNCLGKALLRSNLHKTALTSTATKPFL